MHPRHKPETPDTPRRTSNISLSLSHTETQSVEQAAGSYSKTHSVAENNRVSAGKLQCTVV
eukprot:m.331755 g.331755  ORF g.331755 m.331755 type:complete len:61 (+) comp19773_c0_seq4:8112-8294(+)